MDQSDIGAAGANGASGQFPGASGVVGDPGGNAGAEANAATDASNSASAVGGLGGNGGDGAASATPAQGGGRAGNGNSGGFANAHAVVGLAAADDVASATATGGGGGNGGIGGAPSALSGVGGNGGAATASASALNTAGDATATAVSFGGFGGQSQYDTTASGGGYVGNVYAGGSGGGVSDTTARAVGTARAQATAMQTGGSGGYGPAGGNGASSTLTDAVSGQTTGGTLVLEQDATGGSGGGGGIYAGPVSGARAASDLTVADASSDAIDVTVKATGGDSGFATDPSEEGALNGFGGNAEVTANVTGTHVLPNGSTAAVNVFADATEGSGSTGGDASAVANGTGGTVNVTAEAGGNGISIAEGNANAVATGTGRLVNVSALAYSARDTERGGQADARATGTGAGTTSATSQSGEERDGHQQVLTATASAPVMGTSSSYTAAADGGTLGTFDTTDQAVSTAVLDPSAIAGGTDLAPGDVPILDSEEGGGSFASVNGTATATAEVSGPLDLSRFAPSADLMLDLPRSTLIGGGVTGVEFVARIGDASVVESFASGAAAQAFFSHDVIDLGPIDQLTDQPADVSFDIKLSVTVDAAGSGFYVDPVFGAPAPNVPCFCRGTRIATPSGERAVEELGVGDEVLTIAGDARPIVWTGARDVDIGRHPQPELVRPIRIRAHAFADGVPRRDLLLSPDHNLLVGGVLIPAKCLVDGRGITVEMVDRATYHHVELASHDVVLAEGLPSETYLDTGNRLSFAGEAMALHPDFGSAPDLNYFVWGASGCARLVLNGPEIENALALLTARAEHARIDSTAIRAR